MNKTTTTILFFASLTLGHALTAQAQAPTPTDTNIFASISAGGQLQSREFSQTSTFELFDETGSVTANQTVGTGFVFDATVGYRLRRFHDNLAVAIGFSSFNGSGDAAALASIPTALFRGFPTIKTFGPDDYGDVNQTTQSVNFQAVWMMPITDRFDLAIFGGPSIIRVEQEMASVSTQTETAAIDSQSKTTGKAGTVGADLSYRLTGRYGVGGFIRYAGGKAEFPAVDLTVGGMQAAGGIRIRF